MGFIDKIKLLFLVLQKGNELANKEAWKNVAAATLTLQAIFNIAAGFIPAQYQSMFGDAEQAMLATAVANIVGFGVVMYLHFATTKAAGLPASAEAANPPAN